MYAHYIIVLYALHTKYIKKTKDEDSFQMVNSHGRSRLQCANRIVYTFLTGYTAARIFYFLYHFIRRQSVY